MRRLLLPLLVLLPHAAARAELSSGGGSGTVSVAAGDLLYTAVPLRAGINGQFSLRRLAPDGGVYWEQKWGRGQGEDPTSLAVTPDGGAVVAGALRRGCFAARFGADGRLIWEAAPSASGQCRPAGIVVDAEGASYLLATASGAAGFEAVVWKFNARGEQLWDYRYRRISDVYAQNLYLDPRGDRLRAFVLRKNGAEFVEEFFRLDLAGRLL